MRDLALAVRLAWRDSRGALASFRILVAGIALGVAVIAAVGSVTGDLLDGVRAGARSSIGADVSLRLFHRPASPAQRDFLAAGGRYSETAELRPLARRTDGSRPTLVELKGVDGAYPLYGAVALQPPAPLDDVLERRDETWGAAVDADLLDAMELRRGDRLRLGRLEVEIRARILSEPDRAFRAFSLGPRVMIARATLEETGLAPPGAQVYWYNRVRLREGIDAATWIAEADRRFPDAGWRVVNADDGVPGIERMVHIGSVLLVLVGLSVLLIGGVGVSGAVSVHLARKVETIAVLKSLGAPARLVFATYLTQVMGAAALGAAIGVTIGAAASLAIRPLLGGALPLDAPALRPGALALAAIFGLLCAVLFSLWPLGRTGGLTPRRLFRDTAERPAVRARLPLAGAMVLIAVLLAAILLAATGIPSVTALFAGAAALAVLLFLSLGKALGWVLGRAAGRLRGVRRPLLRLALGNLSRPGAPTGSVVMALGLSLTLLVAVRTLEGNAARYLADTLPRTAPDIVFINLPPAEANGFAQALAGVPGVERVRHVPFLHARLTHIDGRPMHAGRIPRDVAWVVRGDRGLSWAAEPPPGSRIVAGRWWDADHAGPPLASFDAGAARRLGVAVGDRLTLNVLGRPIEVEVANLRAVDWTRLDLDFPILLSPLPDPPPHTQVAAAWAPRGQLDTIEAAMLGRFPESPPIRVAPVIAAIAGMVTAAAGLLSVASGLTILSALVVLAGGIAAGYRNRAREMVLLKVLGARPRQLLAACLLEFALLGAVTAAVGCALGTGLAYVASSRIIPGSWPESWVFLPAVPALLAVATVTLTILAGLIVAGRALARRPAETLRLPAS